MQIDRERTTVYALMGRSFVDLEPYDAEGAFVLLNSIAEGLGGTAPSSVDIVSHLHVVAGLENDEAANSNAWRGLTCLVDTPKRRLTRDVGAGAVG